MPELYSACYDQRPEKESLHHSNGLGDEQDAPLGPAVSKDARDEREEQDWQRLQRTYNAKLPAAVGQHQHQPDLPDALHPGANQRDRLTQPEEAKIALA